MDEKTFTKVLNRALAEQDARFDAKIETKLTKALAEQTQDLRDFTRQEIKASEARLTDRLTKRMDDSESRILLAVAETQDYFIVPRFNNIEKRLLKLEAKIA